MSCHESKARCTTARAEFTGSGSKTAECKTCAPHDQRDFSYNHGADTGHRRRPTVAAKCAMSGRARRTLPPRCLAVDKLAPEINVAEINLPPTPANAPNFFVALFFLAAFCTSHLSLRLSAKRAVVTDESDDAQQFKKKTGATTRRKKYTITQAQPCMRTARSKH